MNKRKLWVSIVGGLLTLLFIALIVMGLRNSRKEPEKKQVSKIVRKVKSAIVTYSDKTATLQATGRVVSQQSVDVIAEVQGKLLAGDVPLKSGQNFKAGNVLARIYSSDASYALQARKSAFLNALANILPDLKIDYNGEYPAWDAFFETLDIKEKLPELPEISSQLKIFLASRNVLSEYYAIKSDEERLKKYTLYAPYDGAIQNVMLQLGSVANPGSRIAQIIKTSQPEIEVPVDAGSASWVYIGDLADVYNETGTYLAQAKVMRVASYIDPQTQSINVYLSIIRNSEKVLPGGYVKVKFSGIHIANAMEVPRNAVFNHNEVFAVDSGLLIKQGINLLKIGETTVLFNGLQEGTEIVTEPLANAYEKMRVQSEFTKPPQSDSTSIDPSVDKDKMQPGPEAPKH